MLLPDKVCKRLQRRDDICAQGPDGPWLGARPPVVRCLCPSPPAHPPPAITHRPRQTPRRCACPSWTPRDEQSSQCTTRLPLSTSTSPTTAQAASACPLRCGGQHNSLAVMHQRPATVTTLSFLYQVAFLEALRRCMSRLREQGENEARQSVTPRSQTASHRPLPTPARPLCHSCGGPQHCAACGRRRMDVALASYADLAAGRRRRPSRPRRAARRTLHALRRHGLQVGCGGVCCRCWCRFCDQPARSSLRGLMFLSTAAAGASGTDASSVFPSPAVAMHRVSSGTSDNASGCVDEWAGERLVCSGYCSFF